MAKGNPDRKLQHNGLQKADNPDDEFLDLYPMQRPNWTPCPCTVPHRMGAAIHLEQDRRRISYTEPPLQPSPVELTQTPTIITPHVHDQSHPLETSSSEPSASPALEQTVSRPRTQQLCIREKHARPRHVVRSAPYPPRMQTSLPVRTRQGTAGDCESGAHRDAGPSSMSGALPIRSKSTLQQTEARSTSNPSKAEGATVGSEKCVSEECRSRVSAHAPNDRHREPEEEVCPEDLLEREWEAHLDRWKAHGPPIYEWEEADGADIRVEEQCSKGEQDRAEMTFHLEWLQYLEWLDQLEQWEAMEGRSIYWNGLWPGN